MMSRVFLKANLSVCSGSLFNGGSSEYCDNRVH